MRRWLQSRSLRIGLSRAEQQREQWDESTQERAGNPRGRTNKRTAKAHNTIELDAVRPPPKRFIRSPALRTL